jgi:hypothetical protein
VILDDSVRWVLYPVACGKDGAPIHIDAWERGQAVTCFGCGQSLIGRLPHDGIKPTAHFAHKGDAACSGESALHKAAKAAILYARTRGTLQSLSWECPCCKRCRHLTDLRSLVLREEDRPCAGVVSDVLGLDAAGDPHVAIEVVVTHDVEADTLERYRACDLYVFVLRPSWGLVGDVVRGVDPLPVDHLLGLIDTTACEGCQQILREKNEWKARELLRGQASWWKAWGTAWRSAGKEMLARAEDQRRTLQVQRAREVDAWRRFAEVWRRIAEQIITSWWSEWYRQWREIGAQYARPYGWLRAWQLGWDAIAKQHVAEETKQALLRAQDSTRENDRRRNWWPSWIRVWTDIGQRASGVTAAWRPICRSCRQDLAPDHRCP